MIITEFDKKLPIFHFSCNRQKDRYHRRFHNKSRKTPLHPEDTTCHYLHQHFGETMNQIILNIHLVTNK